MKLLDTADIDFLFDFSPLLQKFILTQTKMILIGASFCSLQFNRDFNISFGRQLTAWL